MTLRYSHPAPAPWEMGGDGLSDIMLQPSSRSNMKDGWNGVCRDERHVAAQSNPTISPAHFCIFSTIPLLSTPLISATLSNSPPHLCGALDVVGTSAATPPSHNKPPI